MRVAIVNTAYRGGGAERVAREMFHWLRGRGVGADFYVGPREQANLPGVRSLRLPGERYLKVFEPACEWSDWRHLGSRLALRRFPVKYDVTHVHNVHGGYLSLKALARLCRRMPVVWSLHDEFAVTDGMIGNLERYLDKQTILTTFKPARWLLRDDGVSEQYYGFVSRWMPRPAALVCHSEHLLRLVEADQRWQGVPRHLVRIGVPLQDEPSASAPRDQAKRRFGFESGQPVLLILANHFSIPSKGMQFAVEALRRLPADAFQCLLVGEGARDWLASQIPQRAACPGPIHDPADLALAYRAADVTLVPSAVESFGLVAAESLACATPVVAFRVGGLVELLGDARRGLLAPLLDVNTMAEHVRTLMGDADLRARLGAAGRDWVRANCQAEPSFRRTLEIYGEVRESFRRAPTRAG